MAARKSLDVYIKDLKERRDLSRKERELMIEAAKVGYGICLNRILRVVQEPRRYAGNAQHLASYIDGIRAVLRMVMRVNI